MAGIYDFTRRGHPRASRSSSTATRARSCWSSTPRASAGSRRSTRGSRSCTRSSTARGSRCSAFPCNQFGEQEPGEREGDRVSSASSTTASRSRCSRKVDVNGDNAAPLYKYLKKEKPGLLGTEAIKWNFTKFLVDRKGKVVERYAPNDTPESIAGRHREAAVKRTLPLRRVAALAALALGRRRARAARS